MKTTGKIVLPYSPTKSGILIHENYLFIIKENRIKICTIEKILTTYEKRCLNESLEYGLRLIDSKIQKGPFFTFNTGEEIFFNDCYFVCKEDNRISCYLVI